MQRYRVNYRLLGALVAGVLVTAAAAYGMWYVQVTSNADDLWDLAAVSEREGRLLEARDALEQYVQFRDDEPEAQIRLAKLAGEVAKETDATPDDLQKAYNLLVSTVRTTNDADLRRELIDVYLKYERSLDALVHIDELLLENPNDPELLTLKVRALFGSGKEKEATSLAYDMIGYSPQTDAFDSEAALAPEEVTVYSIVARHLRKDDGKQELADRIVERMVAVNSDDAEAHLEHYLVQHREALVMKARLEAEEAATRREAETVADEKLRDEALAELEAKVEEATAEYEAVMAEARTSLTRAYELAPDNSNVLLYMGTQSLQDKKFDEALKFFRKGKEILPDVPQFYLAEAEALMLADRPDEALEAINESMRKFDLRRLDQLSRMKVDLLLRKKDYDAIREEAEKLRKLHAPRTDAIADFYEARILLSRGEWLQAAKALQTLGPRLFDMKALQAQAGVMQAYAHRKLGQRDLAAKIYRQILTQAPDYAPAKAGLAEVETLLGQNAQPLSTAEIEQMVNANLRLPEDEQDWQSIQDYIDKVIEEKNLPESRKLLVEAQVLAMRSDYRGAEAKIRTAFEMDPDDLITRLAAVRLLQLWPGKGPAMALKLLDKIVEKVGDDPTMRIMRSDLLVAAKDPNLKQQLMSVTEGMDEWSDAGKSHVWRSVGARLQEIGHYQDAWEAVERAIALAPSDLPSRVYLFEIALAKRDNALMKEAQARLLEFLQDEKHPNYVLTEVKRRIAQFAQGEATKEDLREVRTMLDDAIELRPSWHELHIVSGQLAMLLEQDYELALKSFQKALDAGPAVTNAVVLQVKLLAQTGRYEQAYESMMLLPATSRSKLLGQVEAEVLKGVGRTEEAFEMAQALAEANPDEPGTQIWYGRLARETGNTEEAEKALLRALELRSEAPEYWSELIAFYSNQKDAQKVLEVLQKASLKLDAEYLPLLTGQAYELQGRWQAAADLYEKAYATRLNEPRTARLMAEFYLRSRRFDPRAADEAAVYLNRILRAANEGKIEQTDPHAMWARREAARMLANSGNYQDSLKAERMLSAALEAATEKEQLTSQLADVLSSRGDPASRLRAVKLLENLKRDVGLAKKGDLKLGKMLFEVGEWDAWKNHMTDVVSRYPQDLEVRKTYIAMLLDRRDFRLARRQLTQLKDLEGARGLYAEYEARLAAAEGDMGEARKILESVTPNMRRLPEDRIQALLGVAQLAEGVGDYEYAEKMLQAYVERDPEQSLQLARMVALYGDPERGMELLEQEYAKHPNEVVQLAIEVIRKRRPKLGDQIDEAIVDIVEKAVRDDPFNPARIVLKAEMLEVLQRYDDAIATYKKLLSRGDLTTHIQAAARNNLAFIYALTGQAPQEALELVNEAIRLIGPLSALLDTRGVVYLALGDGDKAVEDMEMAVRIEETPSKYFHLAQAHLLAGNPKEALTAWEEGVSMGLDATTVSPLEQEDYAQVKGQIEALQTAGAQS